MKKLLAVVLVLVLAFPVLSLADQDPIIGCWYMLVDIKDTSIELIESGYVFSVLLFHFTQNGEIYFQEIDFKDSTSDANDPIKLGKWERKGSGYSLSIIGVGVNDSFIENNQMYACVLGDGLYHLLRKMTFFNLYTEIKHINN